MKETMKKRRFFKTILLILSLCISLSFISCSAEEDFVVGNLEQYEIPDFDKAKLKGTEIVFRDYYVKELPSAKVLADKTAEIYFENFHEKIDRTDKEAVTNSILYSYIEAVGDRYSVYRSAEEYEEYGDDMSGKFYGIGVVVSYNYVEKTMEVTKVSAGGGASEAGVKAGDFIVKIEGVPLSELEYNEAIHKIRGEEGTRVNFTVKRDGVEIDLTATRRLVIDNSVEYSINDEKIGYIVINSFKRNTDELFIEAIDFMEREGAVGIIYDLRSNPGGYLNSVVNALSYIAPSGSTIVSFSNDYAAPKRDNNSHALALPSVVLCESTASAGELFTAAMRDFDDTFGYFDVTTVGTKTYGKGVMQNTIPFSDDSSITLTVAYYNPPCGENYDGIGITPDVVLEALEGSDCQLEQAYEEIKKILK